MSTQEKETFRRAIEANAIHKEAIRARIIKPERERIAIRFPKRTLWIAALAAVLLLAATAGAAGVWLTRENFSIDRYLLQSDVERRENRVEDIETMIAGANVTDLGYTVTLQSDLPNAERLQENRMAAGQKPFDAAEWAWLMDVRPETVDVIASGRRLVVQTRLYTPKAAAFSPAPQAFWLEAMADDGAILPEGGVAPRLLFCSGWGVNPMASTDAYALAMAEYILEEPLPESGTVTITQRFYILDANVDDMSPGGAVARIEHAFSVNAEALSDVAEPQTQTLALSGKAMLTVREDGRMSNRTVDLTGVTLTAETQFRRTGLYVRFTIKDPGTLSEIEQSALLHSAAIHERGAEDDGLLLSYTQDGAAYYAPPAWNEPGDRATFALPVFPSDYAALDRITLSLSVGHIASVHGEPAGEGRFQADADGIGEITVAQTPLAAWTLPLPKA